MKQVHLAAMLCLGFIPYSLTACHAQNKTSQELNKSPEAANSTSETVTTPSSTQVQQAYKVNNIAEFNEPWAIASLKDGHLLVTERKGRLYLFDPETKKKTEIKGTLKVAYGGQGGLGDVALHPDFANNPWIYLSYAEQSQGGYGAVVIRGKLDLKQSAPQLTQIEKSGHKYRSFLQGRALWTPDCLWLRWQALDQLRRTSTV